MSNEVETELLPCPFCGGTNIKVLENYDEHPEQLWMTTHVCKGTNLEIATWVRRGTNREEVVTKWNTRVSTSADIRTQACVKCGHDGKDFDTFAKAPKQCCAYIGGSGSGMCLCKCEFSPSPERVQGAENR